MLSGHHLAWAEPSNLPQSLGSPLPRPSRTQALAEAPARVSITASSRSPCAQLSDGLNQRRPLAETRLRNQPESVLPLPGVGPVRGECSSTALTHETPNSRCWSFVLPHGHFRVSHRKVGLPPWSESHFSISPPGLKGDEQIPPCAQDGLQRLINYCLQSTQRCSDVHRRKAGEEMNNSVFPAGWETVCGK